MRAVSRYVTRCGRIDAEGVEAVAVELRLDDRAVVGVEVLGHAVEVEFVDDFVGPGVSLEVENDGFTTVTVANGVAFVAGRCVEVETGGSERRFFESVIVVMEI